MKSILWILSVSVVLVSLSVSAADTAAPAPAKAVAADGPKAAFSEMVYDFGKVQPTDTLKHDFIVTNVGNALLEITEVHPFCGCTTAGEWDKKIEPGKTGKIPIALNPGNFSGAVVKHFSVKCNDPANAEKQFDLKAEIWRPIDVQPNFVFFMPTEGEPSKETKTVKIKNQTDTPLKLEKPENTSTAFQTELKTIEAGKEYDLLVTYDYSGTNSPPAPGNISVKSSATNLPVINVSVSSSTRPALSPMPSQITLPAGPVKELYTHHMLIQVNSSLPVKITEDTANPEGVTAKINEAQGGKAYIVQVNFPPGFQATPGKSEWTVKTTHPKFPVLKVPIIQPAPTAATPAPK